jgi:NCS2 family nucleobase:cation symporter-2
MVGRPVDRVTLVRGLRADGLGTVIGGIFNTFPYTSFSQNVGLVGLTRVKSRWVCATGGAILVALGLFPKLAHVVASVPPFVLGGAAIVMFGMVTATGIKILSTVELTKNRYNPTIIAVSIGMGMIPAVSDKFFARLPHALEPLLHSGILLASISAVLLNAHFNGLRNEEEAGTLAREAGKQPDVAPV